MNRGSANGDAFVDWRTKCTSVLNRDIYVPSRRSRAVPRDPGTIGIIAIYNFPSSFMHIFLVSAKDPLHFFNTSFPCFQ